MGSAFDLPRLESLRTDEIAPVASSVLKSKESPSSPIFYFGFFLFNSSTLRGDGLALSEGGFQTVIGITANGSSTAPPKRFFAFAIGLEDGDELMTTGASATGDGARSGSRAEEGGDAPSF